MVLGKVIDKKFYEDTNKNILVPFFISSSPFSIDPHLGLELRFRNIIFLRCGIGNFQKVTEITGKKVTTIKKKTNGMHTCGVSR